jgi:chromosome segregation ATPase
MESFIAWIQAHWLDCVYVAGSIFFPLICLLILYALVDLISRLRVSVANRNLSRARLDEQRVAVEQATKAKSDGPNADKLVQIEAKLTAALSTEQDLRKLLKAQEDSIENKAGKLAKSEDEAGKLRKALQESQQKHAQVMEEVVKMRHEATSLKDDLNRLRPLAAETTAMRESGGQNQKALSEAKAEITALTSAGRMMENQLRQRETEAQMNAATITDLNHKRDQLTREVAHLTEQLNSIKRENALLQERSSQV